MIDLKLLTPALALRLHVSVIGMEDQGTTVVDGESVEWWADRSNVWFYEPGKDGEDTIKRFAVEMVEV